MRPYPRFTKHPLLALLLLALAACDGERGVLGPGTGEAPRDLAATYAWHFRGWDGSEPIGTPAVEVTWSLPANWSGDPFRVYSRRGSGSFVPIATVTSCAQGVCRYTDINVRPGERYDYFVTSVDERSGREVESTTRVQVSVPASSTPTTPAELSVVGLDGAAFIRWRQTTAQRFRVFLQSGGTLFLLGETDGQSFLDTRAENGVEHRYLVAAIDTDGHYSRLSAAAVGVPRPDYFAELLYPREVSAATSGFRFVSSPSSENPVVNGDGPAAQWRLETIDGRIHIRPLGTTRVTGGIFTSALSCGPGSESDCVAVHQAPPSSSFSTAPVAAESAHTYVFEVRGTDGRVRYGKIRVLGVTRDSEARPVLVFDWAYQLRPDDVRLNVEPTSP